MCKLTFFHNFLPHLDMKLSRSSITQGRGTRFWQLAWKDMPSFANSSASFKIRWKRKLMSIKIHRELFKPNIYPCSLNNWWIFHISTKNGLENFIECSQIKIHQASLIVINMISFVAGWHSRVRFWWNGYESCVVPRSYYFV